MDLMNRYKCIQITVLVNILNIFRKFTKKYKTKLVYKLYLLNRLIRHHNAVKKCIKIPVFISKEIKINYFI